MVVINEIIFYPHACSMAIHIALKKLDKNLIQNLLTDQQKSLDPDWII